MGFFRRRKRKKSQLERILQENPEICEDGAAEDDSDPKKMQAYIAGCCREIGDTCKEIEEEKSEYRIVSSYLKDIQTLENLPGEDMAEIRSAAEQVQNLNQKRTEYQNAEKKISDVQFVQMKQEEDSIPDAINRLKANEAYQTTVKRDMNYLEGEKTQWHYNRLELLYQQKILKTVSFLLLGLFAVCAVVLFVLQTAFREDTVYAWLAAITIAAVSGGYIFFKMSSNQTEIRRSEVNKNYAIVLLNKVKFKYVNITNAVDYALDKYHVKNAAQLNYLWEQYLNEVKEREKFRQANEDLEYFSEKLVRLLNQYRLYDAGVWVNQSYALVDKKEMVEVKHNLIVRRQKLRSRIEVNVLNVKNRRAEMEKVLKQQNLYTPEIREIIDSIDRMDA